MDRRQRRNENYVSNISMWVLGAVAVALLIAFGVGIVINNNQTRQAKRFTTNTQRIAETNTMVNTSENMQNNTQAVSISIGRSVNEMQESTTNTEKNNTEKMAVNTSKAEETKNNTKTNTTKATNTEKETEVKQEETKSEETSKDPSFSKPVEGEKLQDYSKDNLVYSNTLEEWTTHLGIDYLAEKTDVVKAAANGKIKSIKNDPRYGLTVVIEHSNGFESIYSSLLTAEFVTIGEEVKQGQTIATVGNTATFEIADETHLHFEIKKDGENVDPNIYIK